MPRLVTLLGLCLAAVALAGAIPQDFNGGTAGPASDYTGDSPEAVTASGAVIPLSTYSGDGFSILAPSGWTDYEDDWSVSFDENVSDPDAAFFEFLFFEVDPTPISDITDAYIADTMSSCTDVTIIDREPYDATTETLMMSYNNGDSYRTEYAVLMTAEGYAMVGYYSIADARWGMYDGIGALAQMIDSMTSY